jgi:type II secretory pathway component PulF
VLEELREEQLAKMSPAAGVAHSSTPGNNAAEKRQGVSINELQKLIAHGVLLPRALETIVTQYQDLNFANLVTNMKKYNITARQVQRLIANNQNFHPKDILHALCAPKTNILYSLISTGTPISGQLAKTGYRPISADENVCNINT